MKKLMLVMLVLGSVPAFAQNEEADLKCKTTLKVKGTTFQPSRGKLIKKAAIEALNKKGFSVVKSGVVDQYTVIDVCPSLFDTCDMIYVDQIFGQGQMHGKNEATDDISDEGLANLTRKLIDETVRECNS